MLLDGEQHVGEMAVQVPAHGLGLESRAARHDEALAARHGDGEMVRPEVH